MPALAERLPDFDAFAWNGVIAPKGTRTFAIVKLSNAFQRRRHQVAKLVSGCVTVIPSAGEIRRVVDYDDVFTTNVCFGGPGLKTVLRNPVVPGSSGAHRLVEAPIGAELLFSSLRRC